MHSSEPLSHFVDDYLAYLHEVCPTAAAFDGVHAHDDLIEDFGRPALEQQARELGGFARRLDAIRTDALTDVERVERPVLAAHLRARLLELEEIRSWERDPRLYAETVALSLASQVLFAYASAADRARRVLSKLRQVPGLFAAAAANVAEPPGPFVKAALETLTGLVSFIERDLPRAFRDVDDLPVLADLADASTEAVAAIRRYAGQLETEVGPRSKGSFRLGKSQFENKLRLEEGIDLPSDRLLRLAMRELEATRAEFDRVASARGKGEPAAVWARIKATHPEPGALVTAARGQVDELLSFLTRQKLVSLPDSSPLVVAPTPRFYRLASASLWAPGPYEPRPLAAYYYLTDVETSWPAERQQEHLRDFNLATLWAVSMHEVYPGHFLHAQHLRQIRSSLRRSGLLSARSLVEGWAHYGEQLMIERGFAKRDEAIELGQLAEAMVRLARLVVGIRLHTEDLSVEQGVRFFREQALLEDAAARREAERGTYDPGYVVYALGRLMILKLRHDAEQQRGDAFSLREFHDQLLANGTVPLWAHRQLMLGDGNAPLLE